MKTEYWHNPRCSKSRQGLALLEEHGAEIEVLLYLKDGPSEEKLRDVAQKLGIGPREMMRKGEALYRELGLADKDDDALFAAMAENPILIERPIAIKGTKAAIGRPPENLLNL
ncbi:MAG: arsenate reductase (glutaredoxin) [bacterium]